MCAGRIRSILGLLLLCSMARADDTLVTLGAGGLVPEKSTQIVMESEDLQISIHRIKISYVFRNTTEQDIEAVVAFPLPDVESGINVELPNAAQLNFVNFRITADGKPISTQIESRAFRGGRDVTARIRAAGLPVSVLKPVYSALTKISPAQLKELAREGLLMSDDCDAPFGEEGYCAAWTMRVRFYWTQRFPANRAVTLTETYQPVVGGSYIVPPGEMRDRDSIVRRYCGGAEALRDIDEVMQKHQAFENFLLLERCIDFILRTANNWSGPIRNFHLTVLTDSREDITLACTPHLKRVGATRYEFSQSNFRPSADLKLMILQANIK